MATTPFNRRLMAEVRAEMARQQIAQSDLAERLGVSQTYISRRIRKQPLDAFTIDELQTLAAALNQPFEQFLTAPMSTQHAQAS